jgi:hypothetical protein
MTVAAVIGEGTNMHVDEYLDAARARGRYDSDRALGRAINRSHTTVNAWRAKKQWPDDDAMLALADISGIDRSTALLDLNSWRTKSSDARNQYLKIATDLSRVAVIAVLLFAPGFARANIGGTNKPENSRLYTLCAF